MTVPVISQVNVAIWGGPYDNPAGGQTCTITGTNLGSATAVKFGTTSASILTNTATQITCTVPAGTANTLTHVSVTTAGGTSSTAVGSGPDPSSFWYCPSVVLSDTGPFCIHYMPTPTVTLDGINGSHNGTGSATISTTSTTWSVIDGNGASVATGTVAANASSITVATAGVWASGGSVAPGFYTVVTGAGSAGVAAGTFVICPATNLYAPQAGDLGYVLAAWLGGAPDRDYYNLANFEQVTDNYSTAGSEFDENSPHYATFTNGSPTVTIPAGFSGLVVGSLIMSAAAPAGTTIQSVNSDTSITMTANATESTSTTPLYVSPGPVATFMAKFIAQINEDPYFASGHQDSARPHRVWVYPGWQAYDPSRAPDATYWGAAATALVAAGKTGAWYDLPTNEPENGAWSSSDLIAYWNAAAAAVLAADSTANLLGYVSAGIFNGSTPAQVVTFLEGITHPISGFSNHMENSNLNPSNIVMLRQYLGAIKAAFTTAHAANPTYVPANMDLWLTETGIEEGNWHCIHPRRAARQRTILRMVMESFGWCKENCYDFTTLDHVGSGLGTYMWDSLPGNYGVAGNIRAGACALHVQSEALHGTSCTPSSPPATLSFGPSGSIGDSLFFGLHYTASDGDRVVLATNGLESDTVTLNVGNTAAAAATAWDGWGNTRTVTNNGNGTITVAVDDLLTYAFLPASTTVSVVDTGSNVVTALNGAWNLAHLAGTIVNEASTSLAGIVNNGAFTENNSGITGVTAPYSDSTIPATVTASSFWSNSSGQAVEALVLFTGGPAYQAGGGCSITGFGVFVNGSGTPSYTYTQTKAVSQAIPGPGTGNASDPCQRTSWWQDPFAWIVPLSLTGVTSLEVKVTGTSYGGAPDLAASALSENDPQQLQLAEVQILQAGSAAPGGTMTATRAVG